MRPYRIYKHKNCIDVAIVPLKAFYVKEKDIWKLKIRWIIHKRNGDIQYDLYINQNIKLTNDDLKNWTYCGLPTFLIS